MRFASALSEHVETGQAVVQALESIHAQLGAADPDLILVFATPSHAPRFETLARSLRSAFPGSVIAGAGGLGIAGDGREVEQRPAIGLFAARLPGIEINAVCASAEELLNNTSTLAKEIAAKTGAATLLLSEPFSPGIEELLAELDRAAPGIPTLGGIASGADSPGSSALFLGEEVHRSGVIGIALRGALEVQQIVAQGCRPIGTPMFVTSARGNTLHTLDGRSPTEILQELFDVADAREKALLQSSLFLGIQMHAGRSEYEHGDFLVRNLIGGDPETGALSIGAPVEPNQVVQFHLRDAHTASEDLGHALRRHTKLRERVRGALLFSCTGRGHGLYGVANHDTDAIQARLGPLPMSGFFGNGEIGQVEGRTFLHSYTSAVALFCEPEKTSGRT